MKFKKNLLLGNYWANINQTLLKWFLDGLLPKLCPLIPPSNQDGRQAKNRLKSSSFCLHSSNLGTFWLKIEQFWPFEEISIFSDSGHLEWRAGLSDTILKGTHAGTIICHNAELFVILSSFSSPGLLSTFHILIFSSETTGPIATKLWWNDPWMTPFQKCVQQVRSKSKD
jgi:hypothetical protein